MSQRNIQMEMLEPMLLSIDRVRAKDFRDRLQKKPGQLLILNDLRDFITLAEASTGRTVERRTATKMLRETRREAAKIDRDFYNKNPRQYNFTRDRLEMISAGRYKHLTNVFIFPSFNRIRGFKDFITQLFQKEGLIPQGDDNAFSSIHRGHGSDGKAVSLVAGGKALNSAERILGSEQEVRSLIINNLDWFAQRAELHDEGRFLSDVLNITMNYNQVLTKKGKLKARYAPVVSFQRGSDNTEDSSREKAVLESIRQFFQSPRFNIAELQGSTSIKDKVRIRMRANIGAKVDSKFKANESQMSTSGKAKTPTRAQSKPRVRADSRGRLTAAPAARKGIASEPLAMLHEINKRLPEQLQKNMGSPRLNWRTGRFAHSVQALQLRQNSPEDATIEYTYQKDPYQVFEQGLGRSPWNTLAREPRDLIDMSIREIAAELAILRFTTQRV